jgi:hypothetical protein
LKDWETTAKLGDFKATVDHDSFKDSECGGTGIDCLTHSSGFYIVGALTKALELCKSNLTTLKVNSIVEIVVIDET